MKRIFVIGLISALLAVIAIPAAVSAAASDPTYNVTGQVLYYTYSAANGNFYRSTNPITSGPVSETANPNGSVTLAISNLAANTYTDLGFYVSAGTLGNLSSYTISATGATGVQTTFGSNIWFDTNTSDDNATNGDWFSWNVSVTPNVMLSTDSDLYSLGPTSAGGSLVVNSGADFYMIPGGETYTLAQLQSGTVPNITSQTPIAIWVGITFGGSSPGGSETLTITDLTTNKSNASANVQGAIVAPTASLVAPSGIDFGSFGPNWNTTTAATPGSVTVTGSAGSLGWTVTATGDPYMTDGTNSLTDYLLIGNLGTTILNGNWFIANGGTATVGDTGMTGMAPLTGTITGPLTYSGSTNKSLAFYAAQYITSSDVAGGAYADQITFTLSYTP